jgi:predicted methyltransferase
MRDKTDVDLRDAINAISDVVQNRPRPLREFDQIYMKSGDMVLQSELVADWANGKRLAFVGDGDAISVCVALLQKREIINYGPAEIVVFDFDERICSAVTRFADAAGITNLRAELYNCIDAYSGPTDFDHFYTNPPWGASNAGESVKVFVQRGMEATGFGGQGMIVIADDPELSWPKQVLSNVQAFVIQSGFYVQRMMPTLHTYHLDDNPELRSCNLMIRALPDNRPSGHSRPIESARLTNFYGNDRTPKVRYVRERKRLDYGKAHDDEYKFDNWEAS